MGCVDSICKDTPGEGWEVGINVKMESGWQIASTVTDCLSLFYSPLEAECLLTRFNASQPKEQWL